MGEPAVSLLENRNRGLPEKRDQALGGDYLAVQRAERDGTHRIRRSKQGIATRSDEWSVRDGLPAVLAEHSTESLRQLSRLRKWGTEAQGTHCREGEAGQNRSWRENWARQ